MIRTEQEALKVKKWRQQGMTFSRVADEAYKEWPRKDIIPGHQLYGIELCYQASVVLCEDYEDWV